MAMKNQVATKEDVTASEVRNTKATKSFIQSEISTAVTPIKVEMAELRSRVVQLKAPSGSAGSS
eukprot:2126839-Pyramimonas_sp.AAC.1